MFWVRVPPPLGNRNLRPAKSKYTFGASAIQADELKSSRYAIVRDAADPLADLRQWFIEDL